jgi:magnesium transporter
MIKEYKYDDTVWIDVALPRTKEAKQLMQDYNISAIVADCILSPSDKPKIEFFDDHIYMILHFPAISHDNTGKTRNKEIDFIIGKNYLITVRYEELKSVLKFAKEFEIACSLHKHKKGEKKQNGGTIFFHIISEFYRSFMEKLDYLDISLLKIESEIFSGKEKEMVQKLSDASRYIMGFENTLENHRDTLQTFEKESVKFFGKEFEQNAFSIMLGFNRVDRVVSNKRRFLTELRETNNSLLSTKQNEITKTLTVVAFITLPLTLISSIFGLNTNNVPLVAREDGFWVILGLMGAVTLLTYLFFVYKKWL